MPDPQQRSDPFFGRFGLRAGWGILLFLLLYLCIDSVVPSLAEIARVEFHVHAHHAQALTPSTSPSATVPEIHAPFYLLYETLFFAALALSTWLLSRLEHRRIGVYGIASRRFGDFLPGAFWGLACMSLLIAILRAAHLLVFDSRAQASPAIAASGLLWLATFLAVGLLEEYLFRGYLQYTLTRGLFGLARRLAQPLAPTCPRRLAFWSAAVLMSAAFALRHLLNPGETALGIVAVFLAGLVFSYALWRTGSLWWAIGFHMAWDWAQSFLYGVPDSGLLSAGRLFRTHPAGQPLLSGGVDGPEGSLLVLPTFLLIALLIRWTTRPGVQPSLEPDDSVLSPVVSATPGNHLKSL